MTRHYLIKALGNWREKQWDILDTHGIRQLAVAGV